MALRVSHGWLGAVQSMRSARLTLGPPAVSLDVVTRSAMGRHVAALGEDGDRVIVNADVLVILSARMAHLRRLFCSLPQPLSTAGAALCFPTALQDLCVELPQSVSAATVNAVLQAIGRLALLETFDLRRPMHHPQISLAPLAALQQLRSLHLTWAVQGDFQLSDAQVDELRALPWLRSLGMSLMTSGVLRRLLRQPHDLQWQQVTLPDLLDDEAAALLPQLPSLTKLNPVQISCAHLDWLRGLPNLTHVSLYQHESAPADCVRWLAAGLQHCSHVTSLQLCGYTALTAAHLADLLPRLPRLQTLELDCLAVDSLGFLSQEPTASQLTQLWLFHCQQLPLAELRHVHSLRGLRQLRLFHSFTAPMDAQMQSQYEPPSLLLPQLQWFSYRAP